MANKNTVISKITKQEVMGQIFSSQKVIAVVSNPVKAQGLVNGMMHDDKKYHFDGITYEYRMQEFEVIGFE